LKFYEATGVQTSNLTKLDNGLKTIQSTSTDNERTFSEAGKFSTKLRNSLKFPMLNALVFLKYYFLQTSFGNEIKRTKTKMKR
jgi:hypothetical protein